MLIHSTFSCQSLELLPVAEAKINEALLAAANQLRYLEAVKPSDGQDHLILSSLLQAYEAQGSHLLVLRQQCVNWQRTAYRTCTQTTALIALTQNISRLEKLTQQIIFLTDHLISFNTPTATEVSILTKTTFAEGLTKRKYLS